MLILNFIFYSHLEMTSERSKRRDLSALSFITKFFVVLAGNLDHVLNSMMSVIVGCGLQGGS